MIVRVNSYNLLTEFVSLPEYLYKNDRYWVKPLVGARPEEFNRSGNPALKHQAFELFLLKDGQQPAGRIAAFTDRRYNLMHSERAAFFGFFECINDKAAAARLLSAAEEFASARGAEKIIGPVDFNTNYQAGLLVDGFTRPAVMTPYNHRYYAGLLEASGYAKSIDLFAYRFTKSMPVPGRAERVADIIRKRHPEISIRSFDALPRSSAPALLQGVYNNSFSGNWGFSPMTAAEFTHLLKSMVSLNHTHLNYAAFTGSKPIGLLLSVPDLYAPPYSSGAAKGASTPGDLRITVIGVLPQYRGKGVEAALGVRALNDARAAGYDTVEFSVVLENNAAMNNIVKREFSLKPSKTYRIYEKNLS